MSSIAISNLQTTFLQIVAIMKELVFKPKHGLWQAKYFAMMVLLLLSIYYAFPTRRRYDPNSTTVAFIHLLTFAIHYGAQCWVTFIAGLTMFYNLPRIMFGQVQSRLFPMYFATTLALSSVTLVTYTIRNPYETWTTTDWKLVIPLTLCVISTFLNTYFFAPQIVDSMLRCFELEKEAGVAYVIGYVDRTELKKDPAYSLHYRTFRKHHGISAIANITTLVCNTMYLYYIACQI